MRVQVTKHYCDFCNKEITPLMITMNKKIIAVIPRVETIRHESDEITYTLDACVDCINEISNDIPLNLHDMYSKQKEGQDNE